ncbi:MAG: SPOR domain-containing protein [Shinella sp.]|nr:MAG: SPOR domain-containing protein [Shinella sp.]
MVQKQAAYSSRYGNDSFAEDDPLAELARIVGFEPVEPQASAPAARVSPSDEDHFNLEDELLREFEVYDAPQPVEPAVARVDQVSAYSPAPRVDSTYNEPEVSASYSAPEPAYDSYREEPSFDVDLADELELAVSEPEEEAYWQPAAPVVVPAPAVAPAPVAFSAPEPEAAPRFRLPLANFSTAPSVPAVSHEQPVASVAVVPPQPAASSSVQVDDFALDDFGLEAELPEENFEWSPAEQVAAPVVAEPVKAAAKADDFFGFDDLIAEADAGKSHIAQPAPVAAAAPVARAEPSFTFSFADDLAANEEKKPAPAPVPVSSVAFAPRPDAAPVVSAPVRQSVEEEAFDPFADAEFDLQLDDIELDLSDIDADADADMRPARAAGPVPVAAVATRPQAVVQPARTVEPSFAVEPVRAAPQPRAPERAVVEPSFDMSDEPLPFDPTEIAEQEEHPEFVTEMEVPEVPVPEAKEPPAAFHHDYDLDLDTELASLFEEPAAPAPAAPSRVQAAAPVAAAAATVAANAAAAPAKGPVAAHQAPLDDFDAFERALEEDFRRTLSKPEEYRGNNASGRINIPLEPQEGIAAARSSTRRLLLTGSAVAVVLLFGAGGLYAWFSGSSVPGISSGTPPVITADKEPVKVVPEDRGGKSVPNQDKAVYDRVAGAGVAEPKQQSLISSSEEPVDVVQKTLIPETLPLEGENDGDTMGTPVGETEDPRLLPSGNQTENQAEADGDQTTITPRKVRTMIVRPDGTLVAQETSAEPAPVQPAATEPKSALAAPTSGRVQPTETAAPAATPATAKEVAPVTETAAAVPTARPAAAAASPTTKPATAAAPVAPVAPAKPVATETAAAAPAPAEPAAAAAPGSYFIQVASLPSEAEAEKSYKSISGKFASVVGGHAYEIKKAEIAGKGTYYRVRISAGSKADAQSLCERYKAAGGSCLVTR